ncbi:DUF4190 domain-containing protein [Streptomyces sp. TRM 70351]|uniref:DUF4190 domain-containing protein n=1 Tax=Streptomyces sp. TRM 70351 TaxID=3116552 RepID=UPI002E7BE0CB|nr:DUF4190 domain-containing protein [Streptomyces sp. TRM 70351]MEE1927370.1 DUF4190 domain-containing protein [Streptomyces sp. TRM 70351]
MTSYPPPPQDPGPGGPYGGQGSHGGHPGGYPGGDSGGYPGGGHQGSPPPSPRNGLGIAALILGIAAVVLFWTVIGGLLLGLLALVFGILGYRRKKRGEATNGAMAMIGLILGVLALIGSAVMIAAGVAFFNSDEFTNFRECIDKADTQSEISDCEQEFNEQYQP